MQNMLTNYRRDLHKIPEVDFALPKTFAYIKNILSSLDCTLIYPAPSSICAYFDFQQQHTLAFRSDMDALPIIEKNKVPYASTHSGFMHACGHDGHMSMLLTFAHEVNSLKESKHNVLLIFQPAEETTGGAKLICESGILQEYNVVNIFGIHLWPNLEAGKIASKANAFMASSNIVNIEIFGKSAHAARFEEGNDALESAVSFLHQVYEMEQSYEGIPHLLKFGVFKSGFARNVISNHTLLQATLRTFDKQVLKQLHDELNRIAHGIEVTYNVTFDISIPEGYPPLHNDEVCMRRCIELLPTLTLLEHPSMLAEDFSFYLQEIPGVFFYLGTGSNIELHTDTFDFDETILVHGVHTFMKLLQY